MIKNECSANAECNVVADCAKREISLDHNHRTINYLRLSITDRCNLRCIYCMPEEGIQFKPHSEILTYEEMLRIVKLCVRNGIRKVRLTGGEPLVRKGISGTKVIDHDLVLKCVSQGANFRQIKGTRRLTLLR